LELAPLATDYIVIDRAGWAESKRIPLSASGAASCSLITDPLIIAEITDKANWVNRLYVGDETDLSPCDWYLDRVRMIMYQYDGSMLCRWGVNNVLL
jgi:hypothetical protein